MSNKVLSWSEGGGNSNGPVKSVEYGISCPLAVLLSSGHKTLMGDLEPHFSSSVPAVASGARALGKVYHDGSRSMCPLNPCGFDFLARSDGGGQTRTQRTWVVTANVYFLDLCQ